MGSKKTVSNDSFKVLSLKYFLNCVFFAGIQKWFHPADIDRVTDPANFEITGTYTAGQEIELTFNIQANHGGAYGYFLKCDGDESWENFKKVQLPFVPDKGKVTSTDGYWRMFEEGLTCNPRADGGNQCSNTAITSGCICEQFSTGKNCAAPTERRTDHYYPADCQPRMTDKVKLPSDITGDQCVILWRWDGSAENSTFVSCIDAKINSCKRVGDCGTTIDKCTDAKKAGDCISTKTGQRCQWKNDTCSDYVDPSKPITNCSDATKLAACTKTSSGQKCKWDGASSTCSNDSTPAPPTPSGDLLSCYQITTAQDCIGAVTKQGDTCKWTVETWVSQCKPDHSVRSKFENHHIFNN